MNYTGEEEKHGMMTKIPFSFVIKKACLFIMVLMVISTVSALEFTYEAPETVEINQEFDVSITADASGFIYDVKIFIYDINKQRANLISEIYWENEWRDSFFYLQDTFPETTTFKNKATRNPGDWEICVRLRESDQSFFDEICQPITVTESTQPQQSQEHENEESSQENPEKSEEPDQENEPPQENLEESKNQEVTNNANQNNSKNQQEIKFIENEVIKLSTEKPDTENLERKIILYGSITIFILAFAFLTLRKI